MALLMITAALSYSSILQIYIFGIGAVDGPWIDLTHLSHLVFLVVSEIKIKT